MRLLEARGEEEEEESRRDTIQAVNELIQNECRIEEGR